METANVVWKSDLKQEHGIPQHNRIYVFLRFLAFAATLAAALVMGVNKQTIPMVVGLGNAKPIYGNVTAKFHQTPAFMFFVIANAVAAGYSLVTFILSLGKMVGCFHAPISLLLAIGDLVMVALVSAGGGAAASVARLAKSGDQRAHWDKICDKFDAYCRHGGGALIASFLGVFFLMNLNVLSTLYLYKLANNKRM
ncbi:CASP-like protein 1B1 [Nymphaea thermarum]|nr:CASP-like protein 1B1 [Nymphaea thermarum]